MFLLLLSLWDHLYPGRIKIIGPDPKEVPLKRMSIVSTVHGSSAKLDFTLKYRNEKINSLVEARLVFPMDADMALSDAVLSYDNKVFISEAMNKSQARKTYEQKKEEKKTSLLVSKSEDLLSIDLCSIPPKTDLTISFTLYANLPIIFDSIKERFLAKMTLPTALFPSYSLGNGQENAGENYAPVTIGENPTYEFNVVLHASDSIAIECKANGAVVNQEMKKVELYSVPSNDFIVDMYLPTAPVSQIERIGNSRAVNFKFNPVGINMADTSGKTHSIVFLLDCSGSMGFEDRIENAKKAMNLFLHSLPTNCRFEIVRFGSRHDYLFNKLTDYNDESLSRAKSYIQQTSASYGGTELYRPIREILTSMSPDVLFLLTDGAVSHTQMLTDFIKDFKTRIHALGVGAGADINLVRNLARFTGGTHEHVQNSGDIESSVIRLLHDSLSPFLRGVSIQSDCGTLMQITPSIIPRNSITNFYFIGDDKECTLTLTGRANDKDLSFKMESKDCQPIYGEKFIHSIATIRATNDDVINADMAYELAHKFNLLTKQTSLILFDNATRHDYLLDGTVYIPVQQYSAKIASNYIHPHARLYGGSSGINGVNYKRSRDIRPDSSLKGSKEMAPPMNDHMKHFSSKKSSQPVYDDEAEEDSQTYGSTKEHHICSDLTNAQSASGEWKDILQVIKKILGRDPEDEKLLAAIAIAFIEKSCSSSYKLLADKGLKFLISKYGDSEAKKLVETARSLLK